MSMPDPRRVWFLTAARSEYDLLVPVLRGLAAYPHLRAEVVVAGAHLSPFHGHTVDLIREDGVTVAGEVPSLLASDTWEARSLSFAALVDGATRLVARGRPDLIVVAGDREEALAAAMVGNFLGIPVGHLFGGDRCIASDVDEVFRPAISKLAHLHFTATEAHHDRLVRMGEEPAQVFVTGATGLDRMREEPEVPLDELGREVGLDLEPPFFLMIQHPAPLLDAGRNGADVREVLEGLAGLGRPIVCSYPNTDPGNAAIRRVLDEARATVPRLVVHHNLPRRTFVNLYRRCAAIVGNSSSIVIESSFLRVSGILVGPRQDLRETGANVLRVSARADEVRAAARRALEDTAWREAVATCHSPYGDGRSGPRVAEVLARAKLGPALLRKTMAY
jgi:GDP/UDP-N,N'-diacetylbacillosamine 2-epimerase (hydrolysing)